MPACRVRVIPVSGAQHAWLHEMLQAAVHSMYSRDGSGPASSARAGGCSSFFSGSFSGQSPQNVDPPAARSRRSEDAVSPVQMAPTDAVRMSPSTRLPYGSAQPQTIRPSHRSTIVLHGQLQVNRVARKFRDTGERLGSFPGELLHVGPEPLVLVRDDVEEQALGQVVAAILVAHLADDVLDLARHVLERGLQLVLRGDFLVE